MAYDAPFEAQGDEQMLAATSTSTVTPIQLPGYGNSAPSQVLIFNAGPNNAKVAWNTAAAFTAELTAAGNGAPGITVGAGMMAVFTTGPNKYFAAVCASTETASVYLTPGLGS